MKEQKPYAEGSIFMEHEIMEEFAEIALDKQI